MASRATCFMDHQPATQATATTAKTRNLFLTEKSMMRLTTAPPRTRNGAQRAAAFRPALFDFILRLAVRGRALLRSGGRSVHLRRFLQAAFRADKEVARNHDLLARLQPFYDLHAIVKTPSGFHHAR